MQVVFLFEGCFFFAGTSGIDSLTEFQASLHSARRWLTLAPSDRPLLPALMVLRANEVTVQGNTFDSPRSEQFSPWTPAKSDTLATGVDGRRTNSVLTVTSCSLHVNELLPSPRRRHFLPRLQRAALPREGQLTTPGDITRGRANVTLTVTEA